MNLQAAGGRLQAAAYSAAIVLVMVLAGCGSTPTYPQPAGDNGQILVQLQGTAKEGAPKAKTREVRGEYTTGRQSVEQGKAFERVDYGGLEDVVVVLEHPTIVRTGPGDMSRTAEITLGEEGFDRSQYLSIMGWTAGDKLGCAISVLNQLKTEIHLYGFNQFDQSFEATVSAGAMAMFRIAEPGRYEVYCEEDETLHCVLFAEAGPYCWIGSSDDDAFFDNLPPGAYQVHVYAPRLPAWSRKVKVTAGKRETLTAELTVNNLPKVGE